MTRKIILFILVLRNITLFAQPNQTVRGNVIDQSSRHPLAFATIEILNTDPLLGTITDSLGNFIIEKVPVGRYDIKVSFLGYESKIVPEIIVTSSKQVVLNIGIKEQNYTLDEVVVKPTISKEKPLNSMATLSARMLSVEEAKRYAGGFDDPARLASSFAGVASSSGFNGIIVRGNAPKYLQWKMEGIEIPSPNHFNDLRAFGGGLFTGLSSQMLANSDFYTGSFPAEYNNALSGVFDMSMRKGNNTKTERTFQFGLIGLENSMEGPFRKGGKSSYLYNYRASTLGLVAPLILEEGQGLNFQDLSFKLNFPTDKAGTFSIWGLGLRDVANSNPRKDTLERIYIDDFQKDRITQNSGAAGISHLYFINKTTFIKSTLASTINDTKWDTEVLDIRNILVPFSKIHNSSWNNFFTTHINKKFSTKHTNRTGILVTQMNYELSLNKATVRGETPVKIADADGSSTLLAAYTQSSYNLTPSLVMNIGVNSQYFTLNKNHTIEPRLGFKKNIDEDHSIGIGYGLHSRLENINFYLNNSLTTGAQAVNKDLDFTKAHHLTLSYDWKISRLVHLRVEPYYQELYDVPVIDKSSFSFINLQTDWFFAEKLENKGKGRNIGIDITLEKYISNGFYYLLTGSVFDSRYKSGDDVWRNTRFNRNYVANFLIGKEWKMGKRKQNVLSINTRITQQGGNRFSPLNILASKNKREAVYDETQAFSLQSDAILTSHFTISFRKNKAKSSREWAIKVINMTQQPDFYGYKYNFKEGTLDPDTEKIILPNITYKIEF